MRSLSGLPLQCSMRACRAERKCPSTVDTVFQVCFERHVTLNRFHILLRYQFFFFFGGLGREVQVSTYICLLLEKDQAIDLTQ